MLSQAGEVSAGVRRVWEAAGCGGVRPGMGGRLTMRVFPGTGVLWLWESARCESPPGDGNLPSDESLPGDGSPLVMGVSRAPH